MSPIEDKIRDTLHSEAARLHEVRPLSLEAGERHTAGAFRPRRMRGWLIPVAAAAAVLLVALTPVAVRALWTGRTSSPSASPAPVAGPPLSADATPRYYVELGFVRESNVPAIIVGDARAGKTIATVPLLPEKKYTAMSVFDSTVTGAADDRTFIVSASFLSGGKTFPLTWYRVQIQPGAASPVRVARISVDFPVNRAPGFSSGNREVLTTALSGDGTELAVLSATFGASRKAAEPLTLQAYSVVTGRVQHSWPAGIDQTTSNPTPVSDLSWVGDSTVGFAVTDTPKVREQVRALDASTSGGDLLTDSQLVWSQDVPASPLTAREKATIDALEPASHACDTPYLTGNGQAVVCGSNTYSASSKRLTAVWLSYPLATPARPRVIGSVQAPANVSAFDGSIGVEWANPAGTEIIGAWNPTVITGPTATPVTSTANYEAYIGRGTVKTFPFILGAIVHAW